MSPPPNLVNRGQSTTVLVQRPQTSCDVGRRFVRGVSPELLMYGSPRNGFGQVLS